MQFQNVLLTAEEFEKLKSRFGSNADKYIERLSNYIASSGKRYKSHYATILTWAEKDSQNEIYGSQNSKAECCKKSGTGQGKKPMSEADELAEWLGEDDPRVIALRKKQREAQNN